MEQLLQEIRQTDADALEPLLNAVLARYSELFPEWEICTVSVHKESDRVAQLDSMISILEKLKAASTEH